MTSRAAVRPITAGNRALCAGCGEELKFVGRLPKRNQLQVICNVYEHGRWVGVEHYHVDHYDGRYGAPEAMELDSFRRAAAEAAQRRAAAAVARPTPRPKRQHPLRRPAADTPKRHARRERVRELYGQGLSMRAVAAELGISHPTVADDLRAVSDWGRAR